jgi:putative SOS response-associated peptidase YedK
MAALFDAEDLIAGAWTPSYNIAPTVQAPLVRRSKSREERVVELARWGLVPPWASDPAIGARMFNARIETVSTSRAYKRPFATRRALVPADGWYEWRKLPGGGKQPYFFTRPGGVVLAGLWDTWKDGDLTLLTFTVLTCPAMGEAMETIHDRMPYVLPPERFAAWLGEGTPTRGNSSRVRSRPCPGTWRSARSAAASAVRRTTGRSSSAPRTARRGRPRSLECEVNHTPASVSVPQLVGLSCTSRRRLKGTLPRVSA